jgi:hypothetical protein
LFPLLDLAVLVDVAGEEPGTTVIETCELFRNFSLIACAVILMTAAGVRTDVYDCRALSEFEGENPALEIRRVFDLQRVLEVAETHGVDRSQGTVATATVLVDTAKVRSQSI